MTPERMAKLTGVLNRRQPNLTVVMENVNDPHNISAVLRTCDAVGIQDIYILNTKIPRHARLRNPSAASAFGWLSIHEFSDTEACIKEVRTQVDKIYATHLGVQSH